MLGVKNARIKGKTFPLLLGDFLALHLLKTFKMPPLYLEKKTKNQKTTPKLKHLMC